MEKDSEKKLEPVEKEQIKPVSEKEQVQFKSKIEFKHDLLVLYHSVKKFLDNILSIREGTDIQGTITGIQKDMVFKGPTVWILIASIFIASIGLNVNSTAVVIGAMLISPLMGPILGVGLSVGTNDWVMLKKSLINLSTAVVISLLTSAIYFLITPIKDAQPELLARTKPTSLDVLVAIFGGAAGIIAGSRREKTNVIPGVAIATALMPPLCTAGYGLATLQLKYFIGAFYLFFINSVFIALSTFFFVRYLNFPKKHFLNPRKEKSMKRYMIIFVIIVILPSAMIFWNVIKESRFQASVSMFISNEIKFTGSEIINEKIVYNDTLSYVDIYIIGEKIPDAKIDSLRSKLVIYGLQLEKESWWAKLWAVTDKTSLNIYQSKDNTDALTNRLNDLSNNLSKELRTGIIEEMYKRNEEQLKSKDEKIQFLETELLKLTRDTFPVHNISEEIKIQYNHIKKISYAQALVPRDTISIIDTLPTFIIVWDEKAKNNEIKKNSVLLQKWLKVRTKFDTVVVINQ